MKPLTASALAILCSVSIIGTASAGSFGGPGPFRNQSPLPSGIDGRYQLVATGTNSTGIIGFAISNGVQTSSSGANSWIFFVDGTTLRGGTTANVSEGKVSGILDSSVSTTLPSNDNGSAVLPITFIIPGNTGSGTFSGSINYRSPVGAVHGEGELSGVPEREDQLIYILDLNDFDSTSLGPGFSPVFKETIVIPGSSLPTTPFKFRGTRLSTSPAAGSSSSASGGGQ